MSIETIVSLVTTATAVLAVIIAWRKRPAEERKLDAEAGQSDAQASKDMADAATVLIKPLKERINELEAENKRLREDLEKSVESLECRVRYLETELIDTNDEMNEVISGSHKLVYQVQSLGATPVYTPPDRRHNYTGRARFRGKNLPKDASDDPSNSKAD